MTVNDNLFEVENDDIQRLLVDTCKGVEDITEYLNRVASLEQTNEELHVEEYEAMSKYFR